MSVLWFLFSLGITAIFAGHGYRKQSLSPAGAAISLVLRADVRAVLGLLSPQSVCLSQMLRVDAAVTMRLEPHTERSYVNAVDRNRKSGVLKFRTEVSVACEECCLIRPTQHKAALQGVRHRFCLH